MSAAGASTAGGRAGGRVVLEQVGEGLVVGEVVSPHDLDVGAGCEHGAEEVAADAAEAVATNADSHETGLPEERTEHLDPRGYRPVARIGLRRRACPASGWPRGSGCRRPAPSGRPRRAAARAG